jgi:glycine cleavage system H protein
MSRIRYTDDHVWLRADDDGALTVGITAYALERLGEIVYIDLPTVGAQIERDGEAVVLESAKSVVEVRMPLSGAIVGVNDALAADLAPLNADPMGAGWLFRMRRESGADAPTLLDETGYAGLIAAAAADENVEGEL